MTMLVHCLVLSSVVASSVVNTMGDRWAWGFTDWSLKADRKIDTGSYITYIHGNKSHSDFVFQMKLLMLSYLTMTTR